MVLIDVLDLYAQFNKSDNLFLLLNDYTLDPRIDRTLLNRIIVKELGNARPFTTNDTIFKFAIEEFFNKYNYNIGKLIDTMYIEYNPISNKDITRTVDESEHRESTGDIDNTDTYTTSSSTENKVSAYDSSTYQPKEQDTSGTTHTGATTSDIQSDVDTERDITEHIAGKDGDTTYQALITQERKLAEFNIFNWIIQQMRKELFLLVY